LIDLVNYNGASGEQRRRKPQRRRGRPTIVGRVTLQERYLQEEVYIALSAALRNRAGPRDAVPYGL